MKKTVTQSYKNVEYELSKQETKDVKEFLYTDMAWRELTRRLKFKNPQSTIHFIAQLARSWVREGKIKFTDKSL